jgi:tRNA(fMet)-specific endonuclease VapC
MVKVRVLAFLLCERATKNPDETVTLHGLFDRIIIPSTSAVPRLFFVYYKVVVEEPSTVSLRIVDPSGHEIAGNWRDSLPPVGPIQTIWALTTTLFRQPGHYNLELRQQNDDSEALSLAAQRLLVDHQSG